MEPNSYPTKHSFLPLFFVFFGATVSSVIINTFVTNKLLEQKIKNTPPPQYEKAVITKTADKADKPTIPIISSVVTPANNPSFKIALKPGWKRITFTNYKMSFQIPETWISGYCQNKQHFNPTEISVNINQPDEAFLIPDYYNGEGISDCSDPIPVFPLELGFEKELAVNEFITTHSEPDISDNRGSYKSTTNVLSNGVEIKRLYLDWCEGFEQGKITIRCIPVLPGGNFAYVKIPEANKYQDNDFLYFHYRAISNDPQSYFYKENRMTQDNLNEILNTLEFF